MRANGWHVLHFPGTRLVAIGATGQRAHRADINAHAALFTLEVVGAVGDDDAVRAAHANAEGFDVHAFVADAHATEAENATRSVVIDEFRPLFFGAMNFFFDEAAGIRAVAENHVLELAFAALVAHRAVERVIGEQKLEHVLARLTNLFGVGANDHAFGRDEGAGGLQLWSLLDFHKAHAAGGLERQTRVVTERRNFRAQPPRRFNDQRALGHLNFAVVDLQLDEFLVWHEFLAHPFAFSLSTWFFRVSTARQRALPRICTGNVPSNDLQTRCAIFS